MVTINKALDNLIDALAGSDVPVTGSKATRVDQLAEMISDGEITIGGGGGSLKVTFSTEDYETWTCNKTAKEVCDAADAGQFVFAWFGSESGNLGGFLGEYATTEGSENATFKYADLNTDGMLTCFVTILDHDGTVSISSVRYDLSSLVVE